MFGAIGTVIGVARKAAPIVGAVKNVVGAVVDSRSDIEKLYTSFRLKLDTNQDGTADFTKKEALEFLAELIVVITKRL